MLNVMRRRGRSRRQYNPLNARRLRQLNEASLWSRKQMRFSKESRMRGLRQYVGTHYSEDGSDKKVPLNMVNMMVDTFQRAIVSDDPGVTVTTPYDEYASMADDMELAVNYVLDKNNSQKVYSELAVDAMFGDVMLKVGLDRDLGGFGYPFIEKIYHEDAVIDMRGTDDENLFYIGNRYSLPLEWCRQNRDFTKKGRDDLQRADYFDRFNDGDAYPNVFSRGQSGWGVEEFVEMCDLWDYYLPYEGTRGLVVTVSDLNPEVALEIREWEGPDCPTGPFKRLGFGYVPGNLLHLAPIHMVLDLHNLLNAIFFKTGEQALDQKTILGVPLAAMADGEQIITAHDGQAVPMADPGSAKEYRFGGADQGGLAMLLYLREMFSYACGNLDLMAGTDAQSGTATQDRILAASSSQKLVSMQKMMAKLMREVATDVGWYLYNDPALRLPLKKRIGDTGIEVPFWLTPERLQDGDYYSLNYKVDPYTIASRSPSEKLQLMLPLIKELTPAMQASGMQWDGEYLLKLAAKYSNLPELKRAARYASAPMIPEAKPVGDASGGETHNFRHNVSTATSKGKNRVAMASLMGAKQQPKEGGAGLGVFAK